MQEHLLGRRVVITTSFRGVYYGTLTERHGDQCLLSDARMVIYWGTTDGVDELAAKGPTPKSKLGAIVGSVLLFGLTSVAEVSGDAEAVWTTRV
jgi:hypothetical protein